MSGRDDYRKWLRQAVLGSASIMTVASGQVRDAAAVPGCADNTSVGAGVTCTSTLAIDTAIGTLTNDGKIVGENPALIVTAGGSIGTLVNNGTIANSVTSLRTSSTSSGIGTIVNTGLIGYSDSLTMRLQKASGTVIAIENSGTIAGEIENSTSALLRITGASSGFGTFTGVGAQIYSTSGGVEFAGGNTLLDQDINVGALTVRNSGGTLRLNDAQSITGNYTQSGGTLVIAATSPASVAKLSVSGAANLASGGLVLVPLSGTLAEGSYTVISADGGVTNSLLPTASGFDATASLANGGHDLVVLLAKSATSDPSTGGGDTVDSSQDFFTLSDPAGSGTTVTFAGGTLRITGTTSSGQSFTVLPSGGTIDSNGSNLTLSGLIANGGTLVVTGDGVVVLTGNVTGNGTTEVQNGQFSLNGNLSGILQVGSGGTLRGTGTIAGASAIAGTLSPGNSPGTMTFQSAVVLTDDATLALDIDGTGTGAGAGNYSRVVVEDAPITVGGTLAPILRGITGSADNDYTPPLGQRFEVIEAGDGITGSFARLDQPDDGLAAGTRFDALYGTETLSLVVTPADYGDLAPLGLEQTSAQQQAGAALETWRPAAGPRLEGDGGEVFTSLYGLEAGAIAGALDQVAGAVHAEAPLAALAAQRQLSGLVFGRLASLRGEAAGAIQQAASAGLTSFQLAMNSSYDGLLAGVSGPETGTRTGTRTGSGLAAAPGGSGDGDGRLSSWVQGFGSFGSRDADQAPGTDSATGGVVAGSDFELAPGLVLGGALGYAHTDLDTDAGGHAGIDSLQLSGYAGATFGRLFLDAQLSGAWTRSETRRDLDFGDLDRRADGEADGFAAASELRVGYRLAAWGIAFEPAAGLRYDHVSQASVSETGAGTLNLEADPEDIDALRASLGVRAATTLSFGQATLVPEARLGWIHELADTGVESRQQLAGGGSFTAGSNELDRDRLALGAGVSALVADDLRVFADYDAEIGRNQSDHTLALGLRFTW